MAELDDLQNQADSFLKQANPVAGTRALGGAERFSIFRPDHLERATELADRFMEIANGTPGAAGIQAVLAAAREAAQTQDLELVKYALMLFITHHPEAREMTIPPLEEREPELLPTVEEQEATTRDLDPEAQLAWYREDPLANEHHAHWHQVYPGNGILGKRKDRQGELFVYMHQQMLARYDTERLAAGLGRVKSLSDYREVIPEGYDPGPRLRAQYAPRPAGQQMRDIQGYRVQDHEQRRDHLTQAVSNGTFQVTNGSSVPVTIDELGATLEATINSASSNPAANAPDVLSYYGQLHNFGHVLISSLPDPNGPAGVMGFVQTAIRDPVFYRWHRHVDDFAARWQETQPANTFTDVPKARIRKTLKAGGSANASPDIILCFRDAIPGAGSSGFNGAAWGQQTFGGANWNKDFSQGGFTTNELQTMMLTRQSQGVTVPYLDQRKFVYFLRLENLAPTATDVTVRIFLVARDVADDRRMWIEMDKFRQTLPAAAKTVVYRPAAQAAVVRKPAMKPPSPAGIAAKSADEYCTCGWPYNLLLPRGTRAGMGFRLLVMLTDWNSDRVDQESTCGSMSFCGTKDRYPDKRSMGYPFDRPLGAGGIAGMVAAHDNLATRDITIRWTGN